MKIKILRIIALCISLLVISIPITIAQSDYLKADPKGQAKEIYEETKTKLTEPSTIEDIIGEDIILNVDEYQPTPIRTGLLEDQNIFVYALLTGQPTNPTITIPRIRNVVIKSVKVTTIPEDKAQNVKIGAIRHINPPQSLLSYDNMGHLVIPIHRIPREEDVPEEIIIDLDARVSFDVSQGLGFGPVSDMLYEQDYDDWLLNREDHTYRNIYIHSSQITAKEATFNVYDSNLNAISENIKLRPGQSSQTLSTSNMYLPGPNLFDKFKIQLKKIRGRSNKATFLVESGGSTTVSKVSEGEPIYIGSRWIVEKIIPTGNIVEVRLRSPKGTKTIIGTHMAYKHFLQTGPFGAGDITVQIKGTEKVFEDDLLSFNEWNDLFNNLFVLPESSLAQEFIEFFEKPLKEIFNFDVKGKTSQLEEITIPQDQLVGKYNLGELLEKLKSYVNSELAAKSSKERITYELDLEEAKHIKFTVVQTSPTPVTTPSNVIWVNEVKEEVTTITNDEEPEFEEYIDYTSPITEIEAQATAANINSLSEDDRTLLTSMLLSIYNYYKKHLNKLDSDINLLKINNTNKTLEKRKWLEDIILNTEYLHTQIATAMQEEPIQLGPVQEPTTEVDAFKLSIKEFTEIVENYEEKNLTESVFNFKNNVPLELIAQKRIAEIYYMNLQDTGNALGAYNKLLSLMEKYTDEQISNWFNIKKSHIKSITEKLKLPNAAYQSNSHQLDEGNGRTISVVLTGFELLTDAEKSSATIQIGKEKQEKFDLNTPVISSTTYEYTWTLREITDNYIILERVYKDNDGKTYYERKTISISDKEGKPIKTDDKGNEKIIKLLDTKINREAKIVISPNTEAAFSNAHVTLHLPIEKRPFDLPLFSDSIDEEIAKTEKLISKLDGILINVGKIHDYWKKFCFIVFGFIWTKNVLFGVLGSNEALARERTNEEFQAKYGNTEACKGKTLDECVFKKQGEYESMLEDAENIIDDINKGSYKKSDDYELLSEKFGDKKTEMYDEDFKDLEFWRKRLEADPEDQVAVEKYYEINTHLRKQASYTEFENKYFDPKGNFLWDKVTDPEDKEFLIESAKTNPVLKEKLKEQLIKDGSFGGQKLSDISDDDLEQLHWYNKTVFEEATGKVLQNQGTFSQTGALVTFRELKTSSNLVEFLEQAQNSPEYKDSPEARNFINGLAESYLIGPVVGDKVYKGMIMVPTNETKEKYGLTEEQKQKANYIYFQGDKPRFLESNEPGVVHTINGKSITITNTPEEYIGHHEPKLTVYQSGKSKGFLRGYTLDAEHYVEVTYSSSGKTDSIYVFKRKTPNSPLGASDDIGYAELDDAIKIAKNSGNSYLQEKLAKSRSFINTFNKNKEKYKTGEKKAFLHDGLKYDVDSHIDTVSTSCVEVYSPADCKLLFNACDPVICPPTRCNFGGNWQVSNVVETGLIGSVVLCFPNWGNPTLMPICITGIHAGLENIKSILQAYVECLKAKKIHGASIGICDKMRSFKVCEMLWREAIAIFNIKSGVLGFISQKIFGETKGGGEYASFSKAIDNSVGGMQYFTQQYAKNTFAQFSGGALPEIGAEVCKSAIYGKVPGLGTFTDRVMRPESPPQFTALLDKAPYSDITEKSMVQYEIFYHIYAGANEPITFSVFLKAQGIEGQVLPPINVLPTNSRKLPAGEFSSDTIYKVTVEGYNEICISYKSNTYGYREECGFGKVSSGWGVNEIFDSFTANEINKQIYTSQDCVPETSRFTSPQAGLTENMARMGAGSFASGLLDTGIIRMCSQHNPGVGGDEEKWALVGECWEGDDRGKGRNLGQCWLYVPVAKQLIKSAQRRENFEKTIGEVSQDVIDQANALGNPVPGYLTSEEIAKALAEAQMIIEGDNVLLYPEAIKMLKDVITSTFFETSQAAKAQIMIAYAYYKWGVLLRSETEEEGTTKEEKEASDEEPDNHLQVGGSDEEPQFGESEYTQEPIGGESTTIIQEQTPPTQQSSHITQTTDKISDLEDNENYYIYTNRETKQKTYLLDKNIETLEETITYKDEEFNLGNVMPYPGSQIKKAIILKVVDTDWNNNIVYLRFNPLTGFWEICPGHIVCDSDYSIWDNHTTYLENKNAYNNFEGKNLKEFIDGIMETNNKDVPKKRFLDGANFAINFIGTTMQGTMPLVKNEIYILNTEHNIYVGNKQPNVLGNKYPLKFWGNELII